MTRNAVSVIFHSLKIERKISASFILLMFRYICHNLNEMGTCFAL